MNYPCPVWEVSRGKEKKFGEPAGTTKKLTSHQSHKKTHHQRAMKIKQKRTMMEVEATQTEKSTQHDTTEQPPIFADYHKSTVPTRNLPKPNSPVRQGGDESRSIRRRSAIANKIEPKRPLHQKVYSSDSSERIRYLRSLGFESPFVIEESRKRENSYNKSVLGEGVLHSEPLKYRTDQDISREIMFDRCYIDEDDKILGSQGPSIINDTIPPMLPEHISFFSPLSSSAQHSSSNENSDKTTGERHHVRFKDTVTVLPIPRREDYSDRIKSRIWTNANDLNLNAYRNSIEFEYEGCDWRNVVEDDQMYINSQSGEKIHPAHIIFRDDDKRGDLDNQMVVD